MSVNSEDRIYVTGGRAEITQEVHSDVYRYHLDDDWWETAPCMNTARYKHGCCTHKAKLFVFGGINSNNAFLDSIEICEA